MSRRAWSPKEDQAVISLVEKYGTKSWSTIAHELSSHHKYKQRTGKQCRQRYHNHLDPKISKRSWTIQQEETMFRMHKVYGNKWTIIAEQLQGRSDNTIKNHFYSTIRRSLRRMSKIVGEKNSTKQLKYIKPSTLSKIFAINTKPSTQQERQEEQRKCGENASYKKLVEYLNKQCGQITDLIMQFSTYKPKGKKCVIQQQRRGNFEQVLSKMETLNELYEKMREQQRRLSNLYRTMLDEDDSSSQIDSQEDQDLQQKCEKKHKQSEDQIVLKKKQIANKQQHLDDQQQQRQSRLWNQKQDEQKLVHLINKGTRTRKLIKVPPKYYQQTLFHHKKTTLLKRQKQQKITNFFNCQTDYTLINHDNLINKKQLINTKQPIIQNSLINENNLIDQIKPIKNNLSNEILDKNQNLNKNNHNNQNNNNDQNKHEPAIYQQPEFQLLLIHSHQGSFDQYDTTQIQLAQTPSYNSQIHLAQTPSYNFPTSFYLNTPALQMYQTPPNVISETSRGFFSQINGSWSIKHNQLDQVVNSLGCQIAKNTSGLRQKQRQRQKQMGDMKEEEIDDMRGDQTISLRDKLTIQLRDKQVSELREKDDLKRIMGNINCSPNSAFKTCQ